MCRIHEIDTTQQVDFADDLVDMLNKGALALMVSVGHRTGLFDTMSGMNPATSEQIASKAGLDERYVREWLGAMTVGRIIEAVPAGEETLFSLPDKHARYLTRAAGSDNIALFTQYIAELGSVEEDIVRCFREGGGVPYERYPRFHDIMAEDSGQSIVSSLFDHVLPLMPGMVSKLVAGIDVLDIGCGKARAITLLATRFPKSRFIGYDLCAEPIEEARRRADELGLTNISFAQKDLTEFDVRGEFDLITAFDAIHDQARPDAVLEGIYRALKPGGTFFMQDIAGSEKPQNNLEHPLGGLLYTISCMHCMTVSLAQGGMGLGAMWGKEQALRMLDQAGFQEVRTRNLDHDIQNNYYIMSKA
ncbi:MAG: transcriptional regulator [Ectothiorhodospiraceae bacterium]|nr:transcriptional regulator [Ectothiorhodospiraceae bacterium]